MTKLMTRLHKGQKGFTLIELLVVIAILGVIAAVAIPNILNFIGAGGEQAALAEQHNIQVAVAALLYEDLTEDDVTFSGAFSITGGTMPTEIAKYLLNAPQYDWEVDEDGKVSPGANNPLTKDNGVST